MMDGEQDFAAFEHQANSGESVVEVPDAPEVVDEPEGEPDAVNADPEAPDEPEAPADAPKPKKTVQERIDEVTKARREAEREAAYWKGVAEGTVKPTHGGRPQEEPQDAEPDPMDYDLGDSDPKYLRDVIDHGIRKGVDAAAKTMAQTASVQAEQRAWEAKQDAARDKFADYDQKVIDGASEWPCSREMAQAIRTSDVGGELAYHLASNPDEARRIATLDPFSQIRALGRLEGSLEAQTAPPPAKTTNAPKPPEAQVRGAGGRFEPNAATTDFEQFEAMANRTG